MPDDRFLHKRGNWFSYPVPPQTTLCRRRKWPGMPRHPGVYAIYENGALIYIGSSVNLRVRLQSHVSGLLLRRSADALVLKFSIMDSDWATRERRLIERLKPKLNRQWSKPRSDAGRSRPRYAARWSR